MSRVEQMEDDAAAEKTTPGLFSSPEQREDSRHSAAKIKAWGKLHTPPQLRLLPGCKERRWWFFSFCPHARLHWQIYYHNQIQVLMKITTDDLNFLFPLLMCDLTHQNKSHPLSTLQISCMFNERVINLHTWASRCVEERWRSSVRTSSIVLTTASMFGIHGNKLKNFTMFSLEICGFYRTVMNIKYDSCVTVDAADASCFISFKIK